MPAKKEHLSSRFQRFLKIMAAIPGGYFLAVGIHLTLCLVPGWQNAVLLSSTFTLFLTWVTLMIMAFLSRNGLKTLTLYLLLGLSLILITYQFKA